jgi:LPS O-antigen subunit length determinant protein (WzzB/FepE family)
MVQEIDAYWLQRRISNTLADLDAAAAQRLAQEVLEALEVRTQQQRIGLYAQRSSSRAGQMLQ